MGFIGQLGIGHVAAMTFTFPLTMILSSIALGIGIGASSIIARSVGSGDTEDVRRLGTHSLLLVGGAMTVLAFVGWLTIDPVFLALGAPPDMLPLLHSYLDIYYPGVVLFTLTMTASSIMRAAGSANIPGLVITIGSAAHLAIDPILIFGWFGFPRMELAGAATAMTVTRLLCTIVLFHYIYRSGLIRTNGIFRRFWNSTRRILHIGIPAMATQLIGPVSAAVITRLLAGHGETVVAGFGVASRIEITAIIALFSLSSSIGPFVGQNWGANRPDRVRGGMNAAYTHSASAGDLVTAVVTFLVRPNLRHLDQRRCRCHRRGGLLPGPGSLEPRPLGRADDGIRLVQRPRQTHTVDHSFVRAHVRAERSPGADPQPLLGISGHLRGHRRRQLPHGHRGVSLVSPGLFSGARIGAGACQHYLNGRCR